MKKTTYVILAAIAFLFLMEIGTMIYMARTAVDHIQMIDRVQKELLQNEENDSITIETTVE